MINKSAWVFAILYHLLALYLFFTGEIILVETVMYSLLVIAGLLLVKFRNIPSSVIIFIGLSGLPHFFGLIPFQFDGRISSLYDDAFVIANYDLLSHTIGFLLLTIGFLLYNKPKAQSILLIFLALLGIGALIEISEFLGFVIFGVGKGWLMFGASDSSVHHGPWGDAMMDSISNLIGVSLGFVIYYLRPFFARFFYYFF